MPNSLVVYCSEKLPTTFYGLTSVLSFLWVQTSWVHASPGYCFLTLNLHSLLTAWNILLMFQIPVYKNMIAWYMNNNMTILLVTEND